MRSIYGTLRVLREVWLSMQCIRYQGSLTSLRKAPLGFKEAMWPAGLSNIILGLPKHIVMREDSDRTQRSQCKGQRQIMIHITETNTAIQRVTNRYNDCHINTLRYIQLDTKSVQLQLFNIPNRLNMDWQSIGGGYSPSHLPKSIQIPKARLDALQGLCVRLCDRSCG